MLNDLRSGVFVNGKLVAAFDLACYARDHAQVRSSHPAHAKLRYEVKYLPDNSLLYVFVNGAKTEEYNTKGERIA